jgi:hypothetical protein
VSVARSSDDLSTTPTDLPPGWDRFERALRALSFLMIFGVVIAAMFGVAGLRTGEQTAANGDLRATVLHAQVTRPGISTPFRLRIETLSGVALPDELLVGVPVAYLAMFDENGLDPEPDAISSDGTTETWTFHPDGQPVLVIDFDARLQPNIHSGRDAAVTIDSGDSAPLRIAFHTRVFP